jgi:hypothetical protein
VQEGAKKELQERIQRSWTNQLVTADVNWRIPSNEETASNTFAEGKPDLTLSLRALNDKIIELDATARSVLHGQEGPQLRGAQAKAHKQLARTKLAQLEELNDYEGDLDGTLLRTGPTGDDSIDRDADAEDTEDEVVAPVAKEKPKAHTRARPRAAKKPKNTRDAGSTEESSSSLQPELAKLHKKVESLANSNERLANRLANQSAQHKATRSPVEVKMDEINDSIEEMNAMEAKIKPTEQVPSFINERRQELHRSMKTLMAVKQTYGDSQQTIEIFVRMGEFESVDQTLQREIEQAAKSLGVGGANSRYHPYGKESRQSQDLSTQQLAPPNQPLQYQRAYQQTTGLPNQYPSHNYQQQPRQQVAYDRTQQRQGLPPAGRGHGAVTPAWMTQQQLPGNLAISLLKMSMCLPKIHAPKHRHWQSFRLLLHAPA